MFRVASKILNFASNVIRDLAISFTIFFAHAYVLLREDERKNKEQRKRSLQRKCAKNKMENEANKRMEDTKN